MSKAKKQELEETHAALSKFFKKYLDEGECTAAMANVIRAFLKDNGIEALPGEGSEASGALEELTSELDENVLPFPADAEK